MRHRPFRAIAAPTVLLIGLAGAAHADDWTMTITVDNQYDVYFGTNTVTNFFAGSHSRPSDRIRNIEREIAINYDRAR